jgi:hypothetical protein
LHARCCPKKRFAIQVFLPLAVFVGVFVPSPLGLGQYSPDHPVVMEMMQKGVDYLESSMADQSQYQVGAEIMGALAIYKFNANSDSPVVKRGVLTAERLVNGIADRSNRASGEKILYEAAVASMLLAAVDPEKYRPNLIVLRDFFIAVQRPSGAFGYLEGPRSQIGDLSQVQYVILALWTMDQVSISIPTEPIERCIEFIKSSQDGSGGWAYSYPPLPNTSDGTVTHSTSAAGLCSLLMAADALNLFRRGRTLDGDDLVPPALRRVVVRDKEVSKRVKLSRSDVDSNVERGVRWHQNNPYERTADWYYYYRYAQERFESFLEIARGKQQKSPAWYNAGVAELKQIQHKDGSWGKERNTFVGPELATPFAILYLTRSTQKAIGDLNEGLLMGGSQLPKNLALASMSSKGKIIDRSATATVDQLLQMMESDEVAKLEDAMVSSHLKLSGDPTLRRDQLNRLARLLHGSDWRSRRTAARLLGRGDDLDSVPALIFALTDQDPEVPRLAEDSLRIISKRLSTRHLPLDGELTDRARQNAVDAWTLWYRTIQPSFSGIVK